jgi:hypothetical protein
VTITSSHRSALAYAARAVELLEAAEAAQVPQVPKVPQDPKVPKVLKLSELPEVVKPTRSEESNGESSAEGRGDSQTTVKCIAYFNMATEMEHLHNFDAAMQAYSMGLNLAQTRLCPGHAVTLNLAQSLARVQERLAQQVQCHGSKRFDPTQTLRSRPRNFKPFDTTGNISFVTTSKRLSRLLLHVPSTQPVHPPAKTQESGLTAAQQQTSAPDALHNKPRAKSTMRSTTPLRLLNKYESYINSIFPSMRRTVRS